MNHYGNSDATSILGNQIWSSRINDILCLKSSLELDRDGVGWESRRHKNIYFMYSEYYV